MYMTELSEVPTKELLAELVKRGGSEDNVGIISVPKLHAWRVAISGTAPSRWRNGPVTIVVVNP